MYLVTGANLHGQWLDSNPVLEGFQTILMRKCHDKYGNIDMKLIHISWSYNVFIGSKKYYLTGSICGKRNTFIELPLPINNLNKKIIMCGNDNNLFLFEMDLFTMWVISLNDTDNVKKIYLKTEIPSTIKRLKADDSISKVCVSNFSCACLTVEGSVYCGVLPGPLDVSHCIGKVCDIQCGYEHYLLLTDRGQVYSWGNGRRLQLGHGDLNDIETPKEVEALSGIKITKISAGGWHSLALSESGDLYAWGWNDAGQLGIKEMEQVNADADHSQFHKNNLNSHGLPVLIDVFDEISNTTINTNIKDVSCGNMHSVILLEDDSVWTTGCNKYGQLGFPTDSIKNVFHFKKAYQCSENSLIKCGPWVTVVAPISNQTIEETLNRLSDTLT